LTNIRLRKVGKIIVAQEDNFDAIDEWHHETNHLGCVATNNYDQQKYYSVTQELVDICTIRGKKGSSSSFHWGATAPCNVDSWVRKIE
jgi:hypothetical protein